MKLDKFIEMLQDLNNNQSSSEDKDVNFISDSGITWEIRTHIGTLEKTEKDNVISIRIR